MKKTNSKSIINGKKSNWLLRHTLTVFSCVLIIALGITALTYADPVTTTIGENISTNDLSVAGNVTNGTWQGSEIQDTYVADDITASNYLSLAGGALVGDLSIAGTTTFSGDLNFNQDRDANIPLRYLSKTAISSGVGANPQIAHELNAKDESGAILEIPLAPMTRVHDLCYDHVRDCVWGVTRSGFGDEDDYIFRVDQDGTVTSTNLGHPGYVCMGVIYVDGYLWIATLSYPAKLLKVSVPDMTITEYVMDTGENMGTNVAYDGTYIYMTLETDPGQIIKFDPVTETHTTITTTGASHLYWCEFDGRYIWANGNVGDIGTNCALVKLDTIDDSFAIHNLGASITNTHELVWDGNYLWIGQSTGTCVVRFDPSDNTTKSIDTKSDHNAHLILYDGKKIWAVGGSSVYAIDPVNFAVHQMYQNDGLYPSGGYSHGLTFDGRHIWTSVWGNPSHIYKIPAYTENFGVAHPKNMMIFDGGQTSLAVGTVRYVDTNGLSVTADVAQIPIHGKWEYAGLIINVLSNTCDGTSGVIVQKNGVSVYDNYITFIAGETGVKYINIPRGVFFDASDMLGVRVWADGTTGAVTIGKVVVVLEEH